MSLSSAKFPLSDFQSNLCSVYSREEVKKEGKEHIFAGLNWLLLILNPSLLTLELLAVIILNPLHFHFL